MIWVGLYGLPYQDLRCFLMEEQFVVTIIYPNSIVYVIQITRVNSHSRISMDILFDIVMEILH